MASCFERLCVKDFEVTAQNGDHLEIKWGNKYTTSDDWDDGTCTVFAKFWVKVPLSHFAQEKRQF